MSVNLARVRTAATNLEQAREGLAKAQAAYTVVRGLGGQNGYSIVIAGVSIQPAIMDKNTYMGTLVRGREMMHLGALKALDAIVDQHRTHVTACEKALSKEATP